MNCIFNDGECAHASCCESQNVACCHACMYTKCSSRCKRGTELAEGEIPEKEWDDIVKMWKDTLKGVG